MEWRDVQREDEKLFCLLRHARSHCRAQVTCCFSEFHCSPPLSSTMSLFHRRPWFRPRGADQHRCSLPTIEKFAAASSCTCYPAEAVSSHISTLIGCPSATTRKFTWKFQLFQVECQTLASNLERFFIETHCHEARSIISLRHPIDFVCKIDTWRNGSAFGVNMAYSLSHFTIIPAIPSPVVWGLCQWLRWHYTWENQIIAIVWLWLEMENFDLNWRTLIEPPGWCDWNFSTI